MSRFDDNRENFHDAASRPEIDSRWRAPVGQDEACLIRLSTVRIETQFVMPASLFARDHGKTPPRRVGIRGCVELETRPAYIWTSHRAGAS